MVPISAPSTDEYAPFYASYVARAPADLVPGLESQLDELEALLAGLDDSGARHRYAPGKWSVKEVVGHMVDCEVIFAYRLLRVSRGDATPLPGFEENDFVAESDFDGRPLAELVADFRAARTLTLALARGVRPEAWTLLGNASGAPVSPRALAHILYGHVAHHLVILRERYGLGG